MNEYKFSALRQFGSENVSVTSTVHADKLTEEDIDAQVALIDKSLFKAFKATQQREMNEKAILVEFADKRRVEVEKSTAALKAEMDAKEEAMRVMGQAKKLSKAIEIVEKEEKKGGKK